MKIVAITIPGKEFCYNSSTAHNVSNKSAEKIVSLLNEKRFNLIDGQIWHVYEVDQYSNAYWIAQKQHFFVRNGCLKRSIGFR